MKGLSILMPVGGELEHDEWRQHAFDFVIRRYHALLPDAQLCYGISKAEPFNRNEARNDALAQATGDMVLLADADTVFNLGQITKAITLVREGMAPWCFPYTTYYNLSQKATVYMVENAGVSDVIDEPDQEDAWEHRIADSPGGAQVMTREALDKIGGFDEAFQVWGYEDDALRYALDRNVGPHRRVAGAALHCWHPRSLDFEHPLIADNRARARLYQIGRLP